MISRHYRMLPLSVNSCFPSRPGVDVTTMKQAWEKFSHPILRFDSLNSIGRVWLIKLKE